MIDQGLISMQIKKKHLLRALLVQLLIVLGFVPYCMLIGFMSIMLFGAGAISLELSETHLILLTLIYCIPVLIIGIKKRNPNYIISIAIICSYIAWFS